LRIAGADPIVKLRDERLPLPLLPCPLLDQAGAKPGAPEAKAAGCDGWHGMRRKHEQQGEFYFPNHIARYKRYISGMRIFNLQVRDLNSWLVNK
jgi:hypothetical protein